MAIVLVILSLTLRGQQDSEGHHMATHQPRGPAAPGYSVTDEEQPVLVHAALFLWGRVVWGRDVDSSRPESMGPLVCSHMGAPTIG